MEMGDGQILQADLRLRRPYRNSHLVEVGWGWNKENIKQWDIAESKCCDFYLEKGLTLMLLNFRLKSHERPVHVEKNVPARSKRKKFVRDITLIRKFVCWTPIPP